MEKIEEMLQAAKDGSAEAFGWLYKATYDRNYYIVLKMVKQEQDAMDILQDTYVKVFQNLSSFRYTGSKSFGSWTAKIASNTALDFLRRRQPLLFSDWQADGTEDGMELEFIDASVENQPALALDQKETSRILQELLQCLSEEQRICVIFRYIRQMKISEIAQECRCSENTVKSRLNYAKKRLFGEREALERKGICLYNMAPFTLLVYLLQEDIQAVAAPLEAIGALDVILNKAFGGQELFSVLQHGAGKVPAGVKTAAGHGVGKIAAVVTASLVTAGTGGFLMHSLAEKETLQPYSVVAEDADSEKEAAQTQEASQKAPESKVQQEPGQEKEPQKKSEGEMYYEYVNQVLVPKYGLADLRQEGTMTMDFNNPDSRMSKENDWFEPKGIVSAYIDDLDMDGQKELFVIYWEKNASEWEHGASYGLTGAVYGIEGERVAFKDQMRLSDSRHDWERRRESTGNFCVVMMESRGSKYLVVYKNHLVGGVFSDGSVDQAMWMAEYKDGNITTLQEARVSEITNNSGDVPYIGISYEGGEEKEELLFAGWAQPDQGPYPTLAEAFRAFFRRKGLDVSEIVEHLEDMGDQAMGELTHTENAATICTLNSFVTDVSNDAAKSTACLLFEGTDWTNLAEHVTEDFGQ